MSSCSGTEENKVLGEKEEMMFARMLFTLPTKERKLLYSSTENFGTAAEAGVTMTILKHVVKSH